MGIDGDMGMFEVLGEDELVKAAPVLGASLVSDIGAATGILVERRLRAPEAVGPFDERPKGSTTRLSAFRRAAPFLLLDSSSPGVVLCEGLRMGRSSLELEVLERDPSPEASSLLTLVVELPSKREKNARSVDRPLRCRGEEREELSVLIEGCALFWLRVDPFLSTDAAIVTGLGLA